AHTDPLTGLLNRRSLDARTRHLTDEGASFVVAYGDLDHFKLLNDVHGHDTGDRALRLFARVLRDSVRPNDIPARYGGEEFVAVLPECSLENAVAIIERIRTKLHDTLTDGTVPLFTVSFGLASSEPGLTFGETVDAADQALLRAKRDGRDRIEIAGPIHATTATLRPAAAPPTVPTESSEATAG
ncbi:MAG: GGDEF domain-containing protein, partial [Acidimicrobiia bacterium]|nr:GGDEF domain-containing protein [Acidimicrobiia bacterium]